MFEFFLVLHMSEAADRIRSHYRSDTPIFPCRRFSRKAVRSPGGASVLSLPTAAYQRAQRTASLCPGTPFRSLSVSSSLHGGCLCLLPISAIHISHTSTQYSADDLPREILHPLTKANTADVMKISISDFETCLRDWVVETEPDENRKEHAKKRSETLLKVVGGDCASLMEEWEKMWTRTLKAKVANFVLTHAVWP